MATRCLRTHWNAPLKEPGAAPPCVINGTGDGGTALRLLWPERLKSAFRQGNPNRRGSLEWQSSQVR